MAEKERELIRKQIARLDEKDFDLNIWKSTTILVLDRIFGMDSAKINLIKNISYDYSSWTLRDTSGASATDIVKKLGREILETIIQELETYGLPEKKESRQIEMDVIQSELEKALRISQFRELISIIQENKEMAERRKKLSEKLQTFGDVTVREILAGILSHSGMEGLK